MIRPVGVARESAKHPQGNLAEVSNEARHSIDRRKLQIKGPHLAWLPRPKLGRLGGVPGDLGWKCSHERVERHR
jgi:hypothetical protein